MIKLRDETEGAPQLGDRWEVQIRKGSLELAVMAALCRGKLYGWEIVRILAESSALTVPEGTIYPLLNRLKTDGLLDSEWVAGSNGHPRKYYSLTKAGRRRACQMARFWSEFSAKINPLLVPLLKEERS